MLRNLTSLVARTARTAQLNKNQMVAASSRCYSTQAQQQEFDDFGDYSFFFPDFFGEYEFEEDLFDFLTEEDLAHLEAEYERHAH